MSVTLTNTTTFGTTADMSGSTGGSMTWSHVVDAGTDILIVELEAENTAGTVGWSGVTYSGNALTLGKAGLINESGPCASVQVWYLLNPPVGTANVVSTDSGTVSVSFASHAVGVSTNLHGVIQQAPEATTTTGTTVDATTLSQSITTLTDGAVIISAIGSNVEVTYTTGQTLLATKKGTDAGGGTTGGLSDFVQATAGAKTMDWTASASMGRMVMVNLSFAATASNTLVLTDMATGQVIQRSGTSASITVAGTYTGADPTTIEAEVTNAGGTVVNWVALTGATISSGSFSGTLASIPQGGGRDSTTGYLLHVRSKDSGGSVMVTTDGTHRWGVGKIVAVFGSSTPEKWFLDTTTETCGVRLSKYDGTWATCTGAGAIAFGNQAITDDPSIPIGLLDYGISGTELRTQWALSGYVGYTDMLAGITAVGGKIEYGIVHIGSNDARNSSIVSQADHEAKYRQMFTNLRTAIGQAAVPMFLMGCQRSPAQDPATFDTKWSQARAGEMDVGDDTNNAMGSTVIDLPMDPDNVHLSTGINGGAATSARRVAKAVKSTLLNSGTYRGPQPSKFKYYSDSGWAVLTLILHGGSSLVGRISQSEITGIVYKAAGTPVTPVTNPYISSATTITAKLDPGLATVTAEIEPGVLPVVTNSVFDNQ